MNRRWLCWLLAASLLGLSACGWLRGGRSLAPARAAYAGGELERSRRLFTAALKEGLLSDRQEAEAFAYLGLINLAYGQVGAARQNFALARKSDKSYKPNPEVFPPKVLKYFK